jgi:hypothetical protein
MIARTLCIGLLTGLMASSAEPATIHGRVFTAAHEESLLSAAPVSLVFRDSQGQDQRLETETDAGGHFHFIDVSPDTSIQYVLSVDYLGRAFEGSALQFSPGEEEITFNLLLNRPGAGGEGMPAGHPPLGGQPFMGEPAVQQPLHTVLITLWIAVLFAGLALLIRRGPGARGELKPSPKAQSLIRDIASLDNRHSEGIMGDEEYQKVRTSLLQQLRALAGERRRS